MATVLAAVAFAVGLAVVVAVLGSAIRTVILPRGGSSRLGRFVFINLRLLMKPVIRRSTVYERRDRVLSVLAPVGLLALLTSWLVLVFAGFAAMDWGLGVYPIRHAFTLAGSSMFTLGFSTPPDLPTTALAFADAGVGLLLLALLITFLPLIYTAYQERERTVTRNEVRAGRPPTGWNLLIRLHRLERLDFRTEIWAEWEQWFVAVEQTHTMFPSLTFFRSPQPDQSWVTAAGAVLDGSALSASCLDLPRDLEAELTIRAGYLCLHRIATLFRLPHPSDPLSTDPIAVSRQEFDEVFDQMAEAGVPLKADRDQCWRDFAGWRVNYDTVLIRLATLTEAPIAPWSSDRGLVAGHRLTFIERIRQ
jgi:hypothetical protein